MWERPWRWLVALVAAVVIIGLGNQLVLAAGGSEFLGLGLIPRLAVLVALVFGLSALVLPSPEKMKTDRPRPITRSRQQQGG
jgi:hypothetical protein